MQWLVGCCARAVLSTNIASDTCPISQFHRGSCIMGSCTHVLDTGSLKLAMIDHGCYHDKARFLINNTTQRMDQNGTFRSRSMRTEKVQYAMLQLQNLANIWRRTTSSACWSSQLILLTSFEFIWHLLTQLLTSFGFWHLLTCEFIDLAWPGSEELSDGGHGRLRGKPEWSECL